jgi:hypothetical protein
MYIRPTFLPQAAPLPEATLVVRGIVGRKVGDGPGDDLT